MADIRFWMRKIVESKFILKKKDFLIFKLRNIAGPIVQRIERQFPKL